MNNSESRKALRAEYEKFREQYLFRNQRRIEEKKNELIRKTKIKKRIFNSKNIIAGLLIGTTMFTTSCKTNESSTDIDVIKDLKFEVEVHGGVKDVNSDKFIYNLSEHIESGTCNIPNNGTNIEDRISEYCNKNNLPECVKVAAIETHVADARTCCLNPAASTHRQMTDEQLKEAGVPAELVRISLGLEDKEDLIADISQALDAIAE